MKNIYKYAIGLLLLLTIMAGVTATDALISRERVIPVEDQKRELGLDTELELEEKYKELGEKAVEKEIVSRYTQLLLEELRKCVNSDYDTLMRCYDALDNINQPRNIRE